MLEYSLYGKDEINEGFDGERGRKEVIWDVVGESVGLMFLADFVRGL